MTPKRAVLAPTPSAIVRMAAAANTGFRQRERRAIRMPYSILRAPRHICYFTPDISRTVGLISSVSTTAAPMLKAATDPNKVGSGMEL
ncbi:exported hypothetical protein [Candidatus Sulfopaludibacter sp. SbA3]|nr:exported hypothetical protein [Candidatus Sulfopaludibacter sp. SbA3]